MEADLLVDRTDFLRLDAGRRLAHERRSKMGQFLTPPPVARFMAALSEPTSRHVRLIDPGAGVGSLSAAWIAEICGRKRRPESISLTTYEADRELIGYLEQTVKACAETCRQVGIEFEANIVEGDFIAAAVDILADRPLLDSNRQAFDCAILNPPYRKLNSQSETRRALRSVGIETSNLYAAFLWLTFRLLAPGGEMIAITPRSFCNGPYFRPFRAAFLREMSIRRIHVFECRKSAFKEDEVLQENIVFRSVKTSKTGTAVISSSHGPDEDIALREIPTTELVDRNDSDLVIHIVPDELGVRVAANVKGFASTLEQLNVEVSTGRVVDFRARKYLAFAPNGKTVPLIYPSHFEDGFVTWPRYERKPDYLKLAPATQSLLVSAGYYVLVKRFSAKEEKRRLVAAICEPSRLQAEGYGFENHLNYFHRNGGGLPPRLAKGLAAYLNSTLVDAYFRQFSGHTQVNASDLRSLTYPGTAALERMGGEIGEVFPDQSAIDKLIRKELNMTGDDPVKVKQRIDEAISILKSLGLPKGQQNERSAFTLLALLDLKPDTEWQNATAPLCGISQMMDWFAEHYGKRYAENTRESVRRQSIHQMLEAGIIVINPDDPKRPTNSGKTVYKIEQKALELLRSFGTAEWEKSLRAWLASAPTLQARYAKDREMKRIPLALPEGKKITLSQGGQNVLVKHVIDEFCPRFTPGGMPIYVGDTDTKFAHFDEAALEELGVSIEAHGKMPDVIIYHAQKNWLVLIEAVTSHGPVDGKRRDELQRLFKNPKAGLVFVTAFLDRAAMVKWLEDISWETEVWVADAPAHLIHFNGVRFLGPYE